MKRSGTRRPWSQIIILNRARKARNINGNYSALSELHGHCAHLPGATRLTLFGACPWLSYSAPLALNPALIFRAFGAKSGFHIPRLWRFISEFLCKATKPTERRYSELMLSPFLICLTLITGALAQDNQSPKPPRRLWLRDAWSTRTRANQRHVIAFNSLRQNRCLILAHAYGSASNVPAQIRALVSESKEQREQVHSMKVTSWAMRACG